MALSSNALCAKAKAMYGYRIGEEGYSDLCSDPSAGSPWKDGAPRKADNFTGNYRLQHPVIDAIRHFHLFGSAHCPAGATLCPTDTGSRPL